MSALSEAKIRLIFRPDSVFFASLMYQITWEYSPHVPTAGVNATHCYVNQIWFDALTDDEQVGLIVHEIMHLVLMHQCRLGARDHKLWNIAGDYLINYTVVDQGYTLPPQGLYNKDLNDKYTTEEIYDLLVDDSQKEKPEYVPEEFDCDLGNSGDSPNDKPQELNPTEAKALESKIAQVVTNAVTQTKLSGKVGKLPNGVELLIQSVLYPKIAWTQILYQYFCEMNKDDYSTQRRNRRYKNVFVPALYSETMGEISTYLDISCSVTDEQFANQHTEMMHIKTSLNPSKMEIIEFDTTIKKVRTFSSEDSIHNLVFTGRGGTCLRQVGARIAKSKAEVHVIFTDGYVNLEPVESQRTKNIIWCIIDNEKFTAKHGKVIHLN